jgi:hypothetical protein
MEKTIYFKEGGKQNTIDTLEVVKEWIEKEEIKTIVLASSSGTTAKEGMEMIEDREIKLIVIGEDKKDFNKEVEEEIKKRKGEVLYASEINYTFPEEIQNTLYMFSQGMKVCVEIVMIACNAGVIKEGEKVIAIAGTGGGADTACVIEGRGSKEIEKIKIQKIITKPLI